MLIDLWKLIDILRATSTLRRTSSALSHSGGNTAYVRDTAHLPDMMDLIMTPLLVPGHLLAIDHEDSVSAAQVPGLGSCHLLNGTNDKSHYKLERLSER